MIHLAGGGCHEGFATANSKGECTDGHYVGIFSIDDNDKIWVANSAFSNDVAIESKEDTEEIRFECSKRYLIASPLSCILISFLENIKFPKEIETSSKVCNVFNIAIAS